MSKLTPLARAGGKALNNALQTSKNGNRLLSASFDSSPYDLHLLDSGPPVTAELTREDGLVYYRTMARIRSMEQAIYTLYSKKKVRGFCHLYSGEEAVGVGIRSAMQREDTAITSYRCHAWVFLMGVPMQSVIAELVAVKSGISRGKGGSMHMYGPSFYGGNAIVGSQVPLGTGVALAHQYMKDGGICVTAYGDGASDQGQVFEAMNLAKLLSLPVLYLVENNIYSMGTALKRHSSDPNLFRKGDVIPGIRLDGMNVLAVREGAKFCLDYIRSGKGPIIMEAVTYRFFGHSLSDPGTSYRSREEVKDVKDNKDPIKLLKAKMVSSNLATEEELKVISSQAKKEATKCIEAVMKDTEPSIEETAHDIYSNYKGVVKMPGYGKSFPHKNSGTFKDGKNK